MQLYRFEAYKGDVIMGDYDISYLGLFFSYIHLMNLLLGLIYSLALSLRYKEKRAMPIILQYILITERKSGVILKGAFLA